MKTLTYFAAARNGTNPKYEQVAEHLGRFVGQYDCKVKYGASSFGLMGAFARGVIQGASATGSAAKVYGAVPGKFAAINKPEDLGIDFILTKDMTERKSYLLDGADAFLVLPGGTGTLDEIFEVTENDYMPADRDPRFKDYSIRPIYILNIDGYYDHLKLFFDRMMDDGLLIPQKIAAVQFFDTVEEIEVVLDGFLKAN